MMKTVWCYIDLEMTRTYWLSATDKETADAYAAVHKLIFRRVIFSPPEGHVIAVELP